MKQAPLPDKAHLNEMDLFVGLNASEITRLHEAMQYRLFEKNEVVLAQGQSSKAVFFLHQGIVKVCDDPPQVSDAKRNRMRPIVVNIVGPGAILGEINALDGQGHTANVIALENAACFMLGTEEFCLFRGQIPQFSASLDRHFASLVRRQTTRYCHFLQLDLTGRIASVLLNLAERFGVPYGDAGCLITVRLTHSLLGDMTGHPRENVGRKLEVFRRQQWIAPLPDHRIAILNPDALARHCRHSLNA